MPDVQLVYMAKIRQGFVVVLAVWAGFANAQLEGLDQAIPVQHMVMVGAPSFQSASATGVQVEEKTAVAKPAAKADQANKKAGADTVLHAEAKPAQNQKTTSKTTVNQRALNNWAVDAATAIFSYSSTHLERDKKNNAEFCQLMAWADIQSKLFAKPGALLRAVSDKHIDSKAFAVGPPVFLHAEKTLDGAVYWIKVPIMLVLYYPEEQKKGLLQVKMGIMTQKDASPFVLHKMSIEKMPNKKAPEDLLL